MELDLDTILWCLTRRIYFRIRNVDLLHRWPQLKFRALEGLPLLVAKLPRPHHSDAAQTASIALHLVPSPQYHLRVKEISHHAI